MIGIIGIIFLVGCVGELEDCRYYCLADKYSCYMGCKNCEPKDCSINVTEAKENCFIECNE